MKVRMVFQPFGDCFSFDDAIAHALDDERLTELSVVVAWAKESGLQHIRPHLQTFRARGGKARILLGVDAGGATLEGLRAAINDFDDARVLYDAQSRTFHPKLYMVTGKAASVVIVGSGNLTAGGIRGNYEAGTYLELDLDDAADIQVHKSVTHYIERLQNAEISHPLTPQLIQQLPGYFRIGSEVHSETNKSDDDTFGTSGNPKGAAQLFGTSHEKMKSYPPPLPATNSAITPGSEAGNERKAVRLLGEHKRGQSFALPLPGGTTGQVPCETVAELIFWCWDTAHNRRPFTVEARKRGVLAAADWSADYQYIGLNPGTRRGKKPPPSKGEIAGHLLDKLKQA